MLYNDEERIKTCVVGLVVQFVATLVATSFQIG